MSARNPAAPILREAAKRMHQRACELAKAHSVGGAGRIWKNPRHLKEYEEARHLALQLKRLSAALGPRPLAAGPRHRQPPRPGACVNLLALARAQGKVGRIDSAIEATLALQLREAKAPAWERNHKAIPGRKLEIDFAFPRLRFGIEVQGHVHRIRHMFESDAEKVALLMLEGWQLLPVTGRTIRSGQALVWALRLIQRRADDLGLPLHQ